MAARTHKTLHGDVQVTQQGTDFNRALEKELKAAKAEANKARKDAVGLLTPDLIRKHIKSGQDLVLQYGKQGSTKTYDTADLQRFARAIDKSKTKHAQKMRGVPLMALENNSASVDIKRSQSVRNATVYKIKGNMLFFRVSGNSQQFYQVRIRLEDWDSVLSEAYTNIHVAARKVAVGRISFDCQCGRHQYWYRYLTHIGGFAVEPPAEQDFPKIRNPGLKGCCCKHVLKVLRVLKSNSVQRFIAQELEKSSKSVGFASDARTRFLKDSELKDVARARGVYKNPKEARQAYRKFQQDAAKFIEEAKKDKGTQEKLSSLKPKKAAKRPPAQESKAKPNVLKQGNGLSSQERRALILSVKDMSKTHQMLKLGQETWDSMLNDIATAHKVSRDDLNTIRQEEKLP